MKGSILAAILIFGAVTVAHADFASGLRSYEAGYYNAAYKEWLPLAESGDPAAQRNLGHLYRLGQGVTKDFVKAADWYRKSAKQGFARAQANLGNMYLRGQGVPKDPITAAKWFRRAGKQNHSIAQYNLGLMYENGIGLVQDDVAALGWYYRASTAGHPKAAQRLASLVSQAAALPAYTSLPPTEPENKKSPASVQKRKPAPPLYGESDTESAKENHSSANDIVAEEDTNAESPVQQPAVAPHSIIVLEARENAERALASAVASGRATEAIGDTSVKPDAKSVVDTGHETAPDATATEELPKAGAADPPHPVIVAEAAAARETLPLGVTLDAGLAAYQAHDYEAALHLWLPRAESGDLNAQFFVGGLYRDGAGVPVDLVWAFHWWTLAAEQGHMQAEKLLADLRFEILPEELDAARKLRK